MTPENFIYWLNGFLEIAKPATINEEQIQEIKNHIALVLRKETPIQNLSMGNTPAGTGISLNDFKPYGSGPPLLHLYHRGSC